MLYYLFFPQKSHLNKKSLVKIFKNLFKKYLEGSTTCKFKVNYEDFFVDKKNQEAFKL